MRMKYNNMKRVCLRFMLLLVVVLGGATSMMAQTTWVVKNSGDWSDYRNWTIDLSGQSFINENNEIPKETDNVIVPAGKEINFGGESSLVVNELTVEGKLVISNTSELIVTLYEGLGTISVPNMNSIDPAKVASFEGTWELKGDNIIAGGTYNSVVVAAGVQKISGDVIVKGDLTIKNGASVVYEPGAYRATVHNLVVESGAILTSKGTVGEGQESELHITGDFVNKGTVTFCEGERAADNINKTKRVVLYFEGDEDGEFSAEGTTTLYRLVCSKSVTATQTIVAPGGITMLGKTEGMTSYKDLPWVPERGVLKLGEGVNIEHWAEVLALNEYNSVNLMNTAGNMYIPENATLWIAGANLKVGIQKGKNQHGNEVDKSSNVLIAGTLKITAGKLSLEDKTGGIFFVNSLYGEERRNVSSSLLIDGGVIETTRIACLGEGGSYSQNLRPAVYNQTGGEVLMNKQFFQWTSELGHSSQALYLGSGSKFLMSGGSIKFYYPVPGGAGNTVRGMLLLDSSMKAIESNVSGGDIEVIGSNVTSFDIFAPFKLNNLTVRDGANVIMSKIDSRPEYSTLILEGDLKVLGNSKFSTQFNVELGGSLVVDAGATFTASHGDNIADLSTLTLTGKNDATYIENSGNLKWLNVRVEKNKASMTIDESSKMGVCGTLTSVGGNLVGTVEFSNTLNQSIVDKNGGLAGVTLSLEKASGDVIIEDDTKLNSVYFARDYRFNLRNKNLTLNEYPTSNVGWNVNTCFMTDNTPTAGGLTLPLPTTLGQGKIFPVGCDNTYMPVEPVYTSQERKMVTVVPVHVTPIGANQAWPIYWRIKSDVETYVGDTYKCTTSGVSGQASLMVVVGNTWNKVEGDRQIENNSVVTYRDYTSGDFVIGPENAFGGSSTYVSMSSGNWSDAIWSNDGGKNFISGNQISTSDKVIISAGHQVIANTAINANNIYISRDGDNVGTLVARSAKGSIGSISGNGRLQFDMQYNYDVYNNTDYTEFGKQKEAEIVFNLSGNVQVWNNLGINEIPNLTITGNGSFLSQLNEEIKINGDYRIEVYSTLILISGTNMYVGGSLIIGEGVVLNVALDKSAVTILGDIKNSGTISQAENNYGLASKYNIGGSIENNGTIYLPKDLVVLDGNSGTSEKDCRIYGTSNEFGKTFFGYFSVAKDFEECRVKVEIPVGDVNGVSKVELVKGKLHLAYANNVKTIYKAHESYYGWDLQNQQHLSVNNFKIPETCELIVDNGVNLRLYCPEPNNEIYRVQLSGGLKLFNGAVVSVSSSEAQDSEGIYSGFAYTSSSKSKLYMGADTKLNAAFVTSYSSDASIDLETTSNATINIVPSNSIYGTYGAFDIRGGRVSMSDSSIVNINNATTNTFPSLYYNPVTSNVGKAQFNILTNKSPFMISAYSTLGSLNVSDVAQVELYDNKLMLGGGLYVAGQFDAKGYDVEVAGDMSVIGAYISSGNKTLFNNSSEEQTLSTTNASLELFGFESSAKKLNVSSLVNVADNFTVTSGEVALAEVMSVKGDVLIENKSKISGHNLVVNGARAQLFDCEGTIDNLTINNERGVISSRQQANPIVITNKLTLTNGVFNIGGNLLELRDGASIVGTAGFSSNCMVATYNSPTDRGIRVCMKPGKSYSMLLPFGEASKYTPIQLNALTSSAEGSVTFVPNNDTEPSVVSFKNDGNYLHFYWTVKASGVNITSGEFECHGLLRDAKGYSNGNYVTAFLNLSNSKWFKDGGEIAVENDDMLLTFSPRGNATDIAGRYTAGQSDHLPNALMTYIAAADGNWSDAIWKVYDVDTQQSIGNFVKPSSMSGCAVIIDADVTMSADDNNIKMSSLVINEGKTLNVGTTRNNQVGHISGTGTLKVEDGDAVPSGVYDDFFDVGGGTIEYGGSTDYNVFVTTVYANNVIFSGTGNRTLRSDRNIQVGGNVTINGATLVFNGKNLTLLGNLNINGGHSTGTGSLVLAGSLEQKITSTETITMTGIEIDNQNGVVANCDVKLSKLKLINGVLKLGDNNIIITSSAITAIEGGSSSSYVDGKMTRKMSSGSEYKFPVGDASRYGEAGVLPSASGDWTVEYLNSQPTDYDNRDSKVTALGMEYWRVHGPESLSARVRVRWDSRSGTFTTTSKMATYEDKWKIIECNSPVGQTMLAVSAVTNIGGEPRLYTVATASVVSSYTWTGAEDDRWENAGNWEGDEVPSVSSDVIIAKDAPNMPIIYGSAYCDDITIEDGANLILYNSGYFEARGTIEIKGAFTMYYDFDSNPSFVYSKEFNGAGRPIFERMFVANKVTYTGTAVKERTVSGMSEANDIIRQMTPGEECTYSDAGKSSFGQIGTGNDILCVQTDGYYRTLTQQGTPIKSNEPIYVSLQKGWNFVSNPYPFSVTLDMLITQNASIDPSIWVRTYDYGSGEYCWITRSTELGTQTGGDISDVSAFQGIHVYAKESTTLEFNPASLSSRLGVELKSLVADDMKTDELRLTVESDETDSYVDETVLVFREGGSLDAIRGDAKKNSFGVTYSTIAVAKGSQQMAIAYLPDASEMEDVIMPLVLTKSEGATQLVISSKSIGAFDNRYDVILVDNLKGTNVNLREDNYIITDLSNLDSRFAVILRTTGVSEETVTGIETVDKNMTQVYANDNVVVVKTDIKNADIRVYDIAGRTIATQSAQEFATYIEIETKGIYVVSVNGLKTKVVIE